MRRYESPVKLPAIKKIRLAPTPPSSGRSKRQPSSDEKLSDLQKSRPQLRSLEQAHAQDLHPRVSEKARILDGNDAEDLFDVSRFEDDPDAWQQHKESIDEFLRRMPIEEAPACAQSDWLWVQCPKVPRSRAKSLGAVKNGSFRDCNDLFAKYAVQKAKIEEQNPGMDPSTITRKMAPYRDQLEGDILALAVKSGVTVGKWMLFPKRKDLAQYWRLVATGTAEGNLGITAKVSTEPSEETLICVYTYDFSDTEDVVRVLKELENLGLCSTTSKPIYYKCDAYTYLGINYGNKYSLRASLFSSKDLLQNEFKALRDGPVARLKKRNKKMTEFCT
ncbi:Hypothetical predicted protein [Lecanosticta acicola]|uniref:DUF1917-domain-containing protein n=1 Tax=Lecanosticta acicola TaxID=111012 RepID=A0AAI8YZT4_9PEZI|nr:Hypothetical predicted protein [Lecanosticta acicola]